MVVPTRSGYLARTKCFEQRFTGCRDLGLLYDATVLGRRVVPITSDEIQSFLDGCVLMLIRSNDDAQLFDDSSLLEEVHARISFQWLLNYSPKQQTLALIDGHLNIDSYLPLYKSALALGIKLVVLDRPGHWISQSSMRHLYQDFIPIDMTPDDDFSIRIANAVRSYGNIDGLCAIASACMAPVARAAVSLGLPTALPDAVACASNKYQARLIAGGAPPTALVADVTDLETRIERGVFVPQYPLITKPSAGAGSVHVYKVDNEVQLLKAVKRTSEGSGKKVLIEAYVDGPELDVNFVLLDGEIVFFEISDDFPSPGDDGIIDGDFWENTNVLPSVLPDSEYSVVRQELHKLLLRMGFKSGVFHLEARVQDSCMVFNNRDGVVDLRPNLKSANISKPRCVLIEVNPRPPGFPCVSATAGVYGVNMYNLHLLASLGDYERFRALAKPFKLHRTIPHQARVWSQIVFFKADRGGDCASDDVCGEMLQRLDVKDRALITDSLCFFRRGQHIPAPKQGVVLFGAFFIVTSRNRNDVLRVAHILQQEFSIPIAAE